jgi:hypothetical protein
MKAAVAQNDKSIDCDQFLILDFLDFSGLSRVFEKKTCPKSQK